MENKYTCEVCGTHDHYHWRGGKITAPDGSQKYYKEVCDDCWPKIPRKSVSGFTGATTEQRITRELKSGQVLGPSVDGVRGVFDVRKGRRR